MIETQEYRHNSGLKVILAKMPGYSEKFAMFTTKYGSVDSVLRNETAVGGTIDVPLGTAHFLEHKLFEQKDIDIMSKYAELGARPNAFTSHTQTSYLFSCTENFDKCLALLLDFVQTPFFTDENVEKEKGIIGQEINMYLDNPDSVVYTNFMKGMYIENPVKNDIAGSIESISQIMPDILYVLYNTFYTPENMVLVIAGDVDFDEVQKIVDRGMKKEWTGRKKTGYVSQIPREPWGIAEKFTERKMSVSIPLFMFGYKGWSPEEEPVLTAKRELEMQILVEMLFGKSSDFYGELYGEGLINESFYGFYDSERSFEYSAFGGESKSPEKVVDRIQKRISEAKKGNISEKDFERIKKSAYGSFIKKFNFAESICRIYTALMLEGIPPIDYFSLYDKINFNNVTEQLKHFDESKSVISVVR